MGPKKLSQFCILSFPNSLWSPDFLSGIPLRTNYLSEDIGTNKVILMFMKKESSKISSFSSYK